MSRATGFAKSLLLATHLMPSIAVTCFVSMFALCLRSSPSDVFAIALATLFQQFSVGLSNDWLDWQRDSDVGRTDKPVLKGFLNSTQIRNAAFFFVASAIFISSLISLVAVLIMLAMLTAGWSYNLWFKSTVFSWVPYFVGFGILPYFANSSHLNGTGIPVFIPVVAALLGCAAHFANSVPDFAFDAINGVRGLPQRIGALWSSVAIASGALAAALITIVNADHRIAMAAWICLAVNAALITASVILATRSNPSKMTFNFLVLATLFNLIPICLEMLYITS